MFASSRTFHASTSCQNPILTDNFSQAAPCGLQRQRRAIVARLGVPECCRERTSLHTFTRLPSLLLTGGGLGFPFTHFPCSPPMVRVVAGVSHDGPVVPHWSDSAMGQAVAFAVCCQLSARASEGPGFQLVAPGLRRRPGPSSFRPAQRRNRGTLRVRFQVPGPGPWRHHRAREGRVTQRPVSLSVRPSISIAPQGPPLKSELPAPLVVMPLVE